MKLANLKVLIILVLVIPFSGCEDSKDLPPFHAEGKIIGVTLQCYGEVVIIEVDNPKGIGSSGTIPYSTTSQITYKNAIGVPYFSKIGIPDSVPQITGTWLSFEYRELTQEDWETSNLFSTTEPVVCPANIIPLNVKRLMITKIFDFK